MFLCFAAWVLRSCHFFDSSCVYSSIFSSHSFEPFFQWSSASSTRFAVVHVGTPNPVFYHQVAAYPHSQTDPVSDTFHSSLASSCQECTLFHTSQIPVMLRNHLQHDGGNWCIATWLISRSTNLHTSRHVDIQIFLPFFNFYNMKMDEWDVKQCLQWPGPDRCSSASHFGALPRKYPRPRLIPRAQWKHTQNTNKIQRSQTQIIANQSKTHRSRTPYGSHFFFQYHPTHIQFIPSLWNARFSSRSILRKLPQPTSKTYACTFCTSETHSPWLVIDSHSTFMLETP